MDDTGPTLVYLLASLWFFLCGCLMCLIGADMGEPRKSDLTLTKTLIAIPVILVVLAVAVVCMTLTGLMALFLKPQNPNP